MRRSAHHGNSPDRSAQPSCRLTKTTDELALDLLADNPHADLIVGFCEPLVTRVAGRLLGLTSEQLAEFRTHFG